MDDIGGQPGHYGGVLLLGGVSGSGKTTVAKEIAHRSNVAWVQIDDLRLALQWSRVRLPSELATNSLYCFERQLNIWEKSAEQLCDAMIGVGNAMMDAIAIVTANHVAQGDPAIVEGDGILPTIAHHPLIQPLVVSGQVVIVYVLADSPEEILNRIRRRGRGVSERSGEELDRIGDMHWCYSEWLRTQAEMLNLPVLSPEPLVSLSQRVAHQWAIGRVRQR